MKIIDSPKVYLIAKTSLCGNGLSEYLSDIGNPNWSPDKKVSDGENLIEAAGRMCYRSWQKYDPNKPEATNPNVTKVREGNKSYIGNVLKSGHGSILEHVSLTVIMRNVSRIVTHEMVRHRAGMAYCLDGNTLIYSERICNGHRAGPKKRKIKDLFEMTKTHHGRSRIKLLRLRTFNEKTKQFETGKVKSILDSGKKDVFKITMADGKSIVCSSSHQFLTNKGWKTLSDIMGNYMILPNKNVAWDKKDSIAINGIPVYQDKKWLEEHYIKKNLYQNQVAELAGVSSHTIKKWVKIFELNKGMVGCYRGDTWNKGKTYRTRPKTNSERLAISKRMKGEKNHRWKGGKRRPANNIGRITRRKIYERDDFTCQLCKKKGGTLTVHHIIPSWYDSNIFWEIDNLTTICRKCHYEVNGSELEYIRFFDKKKYKSIDKQQWERNKPKPPNRKLTVKFIEIKSIKFLGSKQTYDIEMDEPNHKKNFVANGIVVHNSQESLRYVRLDNLNFWIPEAVKNNPKVKEKFKEVVTFLEKTQIDLANMFDIDNLNNFHEKKQLTSMFRRLAPMGLGTSIMVTGNLRAWRHVIDMRSSEAAEEEIRIVADQIANICKKEYPNVFQDMTKNKNGEWKFNNKKI